MNNLLKIKDYIIQNWKISTAILLGLLLLITFNCRLIINSNITESMYKDKVKDVEKIQEEVNKLKSENERLNMVADEWYTMWREERDNNYWLSEFYYSNVCSIDKDDELCKSGVYE